MATLVTNGIRVTVSPYYEREVSMPSQNKYIFSYYITILNTSDKTVQLLARHWKIYDSNNTMREVKGDGVIGKQPILKPGESHSYNSWCPLMTSIGKMAGSFSMMNVDDKSTFDVVVPEFRLVAEFILN